MSVDIRGAIGLPPKDTVEFFRAKGVYPTTRRWWEVWQEEHARAFTVAGVSDRTVLESVRASMDKVLSEGGTFAQWKKGILPQLEAAVKNGTAPDSILTDQRLRTIYSTNLRMARAAGQWKRIEALKAFAPFLMYFAVKDDHTRALHRVWGGLDGGTQPIILPVDHPAWAIFYPPNGWGCRCNVIQLSQADLDRMGLSVTSDARLVAIGWPTETTTAKTTDWVRGDGAIEAIPHGVDPGFGYNVGKAHLRGLVPLENEGEIIESIIAGLTLPKAPAPRSAASDALLPKDTNEAEALDAWRQAIGQQQGQSITITDPVGEPIIVDDSFWNGADGLTKIRKRDRHRVAKLIAQTLQSPDEIWVSWEGDDPTKRRAGVTPKSSRAVRRYLARFVVDGEEKNIAIIVQIDRDGWKSVTSFDPTEKAFEKRRGGVLQYRRK
jgi:phage-Barnase-EndoU-ColicinE5/D-RelE like nuclease2/Phage Mu protein F like protein